MRRGREGGGGVGGTRYHKSFRAKGSQLSYALKASRVSIGALSLSRYFSLSHSPSKGEFTRNVDGARLPGAQYR